MLVGLLAGLTGCARQPGEREFRNATRQMERGAYERARDLFIKSINKRPDHERNAEAFLHIARASWLLEDADGAHRALEMSRRLNPRLSESAYSLGVLAYYQGDIPKARSLLAEAAQLDRRDPRALEYIGHILIKEQSWREAWRVLHEAHTRAPQSPRILAALSIVAMEIQGVEEAVAYAMQALERNPTYPPALYNLGVIHEQHTGETEHALAFFTQYLLVQPQGREAYEARRAIARLQGEPEPAPDPLDVTPVRNTLVRAIDTNAPTDPAQADLSRNEQESEEERSPATAPRTPETLLQDARRAAQDGQRDLALALSRRAAERARQLQQPVLAERALRQGTELAPESGRAYFVLGRFLLEENRAEEALQSFRMAIQREEQNSAYRMSLAEAARAVGEYDEALDALRRAVDLAPDQPEPLWQIAELLDQTMIRARAAQAYRDFAERFPRDTRAPRAIERAQALQPTEPSTREQSADGSVDRQRAEAARTAMARGFDYQQRRNWDRAVFYYQRALELQPNMEPAYFNLGLVYLEQRNLNAARDAFKQSIERAPDRIAARYNLALTLRELGETSPAVQQLEALLVRDPDYAPGHLLLGLLYEQDNRMRSRARTHFERFLELAPDDPNAAYARSRLDS